MEYNLNFDSQRIDFGATGIAEILQNVRMILTTPEYSCPLDRGFAWNPDILDAPIDIMQAKLAARVMAAVKRYEPRAQVVSVTFKENKPVVKVRVADDAV